MNEQKTVGQVTYHFTITVIDDVRKLMALLVRAKLKLNATVLKWCIEKREHNELTITSVFKPMTGVEKLIEGQRWMMERYGVNISTIIPTVTMTSVKLEPPRIKPLRAKKKVLVPRVKVKGKKEPKQPQVELTINDFLTEPLDPTIPPSKQYAYIKAWRQLKKAQKELNE